MSFEFAYRIRTDRAPASLMDLDVVMLTADVTADDGATIEAGTEGTIVSIFRDGEAFVVEFDTPTGSLATVTGDTLTLIERHAS